MPSKAEPIGDKIPPTTALFLGAFSGVVAWWVIYRCCPKPPVLDKFLEWWFNGRHAPREQPATAAPIPDGGDEVDPQMGDDVDPQVIDNGIELQDVTTRRPASPTETIETIISESDASTRAPSIRQPYMSVTPEDSE